jgi:hypothetical protein
VGGGFVPSTGTTSETASERLSALGTKNPSDTGRLLGAGVEGVDRSSLANDRLLNLEVKLERFDLEVSARERVGCSEDMESGISKSTEAAGKELSCSAWACSVSRVDFFLLLSAKGNQYSKIEYSLGADVLKYLRPSMWKKLRVCEVR